MWMKSAKVPVSCCSSYEIWMTSAMLPVSCCHSYQIWVTSAMLPQLSNLNDKVPWNLAHKQHLSSPNHLSSNLPTKQLSMIIKFSTNVDILLRCDIQGTHFRVKLSKKGTDGPYSSLLNVSGTKDKSHEKLEQAVSEFLCVVCGKTGRRFECKHMGV